MIKTVQLSLLLFLCSRQR